MNTNVENLLPVKEWPKDPGLGEPINPLDTVRLYRAQSILHGLVPDPLPDTVEQALDVIRWHAPQELIP